MKTKFILLCTCLILGCSYLARGQETIDTFGLIETYNSTIDDTRLILSDELRASSEMTIETYGRFSCPFSQAVENTYIQFALENRTRVNLTIGYYDLHFDSPEKAEEYHLQATFEEYYPDRLLDFLELKMFYDVPVTLELIQSQNSFLHFNDLEERLSLTSQRQASLTNRTDVGLARSSTFINGKSMYFLRFGEEQPEPTCDCNWFSCFLDCIDIPGDLIDPILAAACTAACSPAGLATGVGAVGCIFCVSTALGFGLACGISCNNDPCSQKVCTPGSFEGEPWCNGDGRRMRNVCNCEGTGWIAQVDDCPAGTRCNNGNCRPCEGEVFDHRSSEGTEERSVACDGFTLTTQINNETTANANDGSIVVSPPLDGGPYSFLWEDDSMISSRSNLEAGEYCVTVTDRRCCYEVECYTLITEACEGFELEVSTEYEPACDGNDGVARVLSVSGGQSPYHYSWSDGSIGTSIDELEPGFYTVTVYDANNCSQVENIIVYGISNDYPVSLSGIISGICSGDPNSGAINLVVESSAQIISYQWSNGASTQDISNLSNGEYSVTVIDECSGMYTESFEISAMQANAQIVHTIPGRCDGIINISVENGIEPFVYTINGPNGPSTINSSVPFQTFTDLCQGDYTVTVEDANGCVSTTSQNICICPDVEFSDWALNTSTLEYCRTYTIPASNLCGQGEGEICFTPERGNWSLSSDGDYCRTVTCPSDGYCDDFDINQECFTPEYGSWYQSSPSQYCRDVICTVDYLCGDIDINECDTYELGDCTYNTFNMSCDCEVIVNNIETGLTEEVSSTVEIDYDADENMCISIFSCEGIVSHQASTEPQDYGDWEFDMNANQCVREVYCFNQSDFDWINTVEDPPIDDWEYDQWNEACVGYVYCGDDIWGDVEVIDENIDIDDWEFNEDDEGCYAVVSCGFGFNTTELNNQYINQAERETIAVGQISGEFRCIVSYDCGDGELTGSTPGGLASCSQNPFDDLCTYSCDGYSAVNDCNDQCPDFGGNESESPGNGGSDFGGSDSGDSRSDAEYSFDGKDEAINLVKVFPNPFKEEITISNIPINQGLITLEFLDSRGSLIIQRQVNQEGKITLNTSSLPRGAYFIKVYNQDFSFLHVDRIIKAH